jgi:hypothetical protein
MTIATLSHTNWDRYIHRYMSGTMPSRSAAVAISPAIHSRLVRTCIYQPAQTTQRYGVGAYDLQYGLTTAGLWMEFGMWVTVRVTGRIRDLNIRWTRGENVYSGDAVVTGEMSFKYRMSIILSAPSTVV